MELIVLNTCVETENRRLKKQSKRFEEDIKELQTENKKINKQMRKMFTSRQLKRKRTTLWIQGSVSWSRKLDSLDDLALFYSFDKFCRRA